MRLVISAGLASNTIYNRGKSEMLFSCSNAYISREIYRKP
jgi:hypothetical protein